MKYIFWALVVAFSFSAGAQDKTVFGIPKQINGVYIFMDSKPNCPYDTLGELKNTTTAGQIISGTFSYSDTRDAVVERAKKKYPGANGILFTMESGDRFKDPIYSALAIKLKN